MDAAHRAPATPHPKNERGRGRRATGRVQDPSSGADAPGAAPPARPVAARPHGDMPAAARHRAAGNAVWSDTTARRGRRAASSTGPAGVGRGPASTEERMAVPITVYTNVGW